MACARCATGSDVVAENAEVEGNNTFPVCLALPAGTNKSSTGITLATIPILKGYYRSLPNSTDVRECYQYDACLGGRDLEKYCEEGYEGPCECDSRHYFGYPHHNKKSKERPD